MSAGAMIYQLHEAAPADVVACWLHADACWLCAHLWLAGGLLWLCLRLRLALHVKGLAEQLSAGVAAMWLQSAGAAAMLQSAGAAAGLQSAAAKCRWWRSDAAALTAPGSSAAASGSAGPPSSAQHNTVTPAISTPLSSTKPVNSNVSFRTRFARPYDMTL